MLTLAGYRYRKVMAEAGGPIVRLLFCEVSVLGVKMFQANAFLRPDLMAWRSTGEVFSDAAGTGVADTPLVARHKAISEAIERWAHMAVVSSGEKNRYGFDIDPSSNGMAAFPGFWRRQTRTPSYWEAVERFGVLAWWEGRLDAVATATPWPRVRAMAILSGMPGATVILYRQSEEGYFAYGYAAAPSFGAACLRAASELERHDYVVRQYGLKHPDGVPATDFGKMSVAERRSLFFSRTEGHGVFLERLRKKRWLPEARPRLVFDGPVSGAWTKYANVWRIVYEPPSRRFLGLDDRYFFW